MRDEREHIEFVHGLLCATCYTPSSFNPEFSHISALGKKGIASKVHYKYGIPQCRKCHQHIHNIGERAFFKYDLSGVEKLTNKIWKADTKYKAWLAVHRFKLDNGYYKVNCDGGLMFLKDNNDLQRGLNWLKNVVIDRPKRLVLEDADKQRSVAQNKLMWVWNEAYGNEIGLDKDRTHDYIKGLYFGTSKLIRLIHKNDLDLDISMTDHISYTVEPIQEPLVRVVYTYAKGTTSELSVTQMRKYLEKYQYIADKESNFIMPIPDYYGLAMR